MKTIVVIVNVILTLILLPSLVAAVMSPMMFDAPGSENNNKNWVLFGCVVALPIFIIIAQIISWIAFKRTNYKLALYINALPIFDIILFALLILVLGDLNT